MRVSFSIYAWARDTVLLWSSPLLGLLFCFSLCPSFWVSGWLLVLERERARAWRMPDDEIEDDDWIGKRPNAEEVKKAKAQAGELNTYNTYTMNGTDQPGCVGR